MLKRLLLGFGEPQLNEELLGDLVGEMANTIAGNACKEITAELRISPPVITQGTINEEFLAIISRSFVMPLRWKSVIAQLIVCSNTKAT